MLNNLSFTAKAPATFMIAGEHAVLHGLPAIVGALQQYLQVTLTPREDDEIVIESESLGKMQLSRYEIEIAKPFQFVLAVLKKYCEQLPSGVDVVITSEFSHRIGFGSSAAVTVATLQAVRNWLGLMTTPEELVREGRDIVRSVQGIGSGADIAASVYGGVVLYHPESLQTIKLPTWPESTLCYVGYKTPTVDVVKIVEEKRQKGQETFAQHVEAMGKLVLTIAYKLIVGDVDENELAELFAEHHWHQKEIGTSDEKIEAIRTELTTDPDVKESKISGSGLGDCLLVLGRPRKEIAGVDFFPVEISTTGVESA